MSKDPQDFDDFDTEFEAMPEEEVSPEPIGSDEPFAEPVEEVAPAEETEDEPKKNKKSKKEKKAKTPKEPSEGGGVSKILRQQFPDVYSVMLAIAILALLIAVAVLAIELSRYGFDIKPPSAMLNLPAALPTLSTLLA